MTRNQNITPEVVIGIILLLIGLSMIDSIGPLLLVGGILYLVFRRPALWQQMLHSLRGVSGRNTQRTMPERDVEYHYAPVPQRSSSNNTQGRIYHHALDAVEAAGLDPETVSVLATDIGLMSFKDGHDPVVHRTRDIDDDVDYIQPYIQLRLPTAAIGLIRFEIIDADGQRLFVHEERHQLERGRNLITPAARLPVHDAFNTNREWRLNVSADGMPLAVHYFSWEESREKVVRRYLSEDGEISNELRAVMAESRLQEMSLDELLADQSDEPDQYSRSR